MISGLKLWLYGGVAIVIVGIITYGVASIYKAGKDEVYDKLKDDRITILEDGKAIDKKVLGADDDTLVCMLVDCSVSDRPDSDKPL